MDNSRTAFETKPTSVGALTVLGAAEFKGADFGTPAANVMANTLLKDVCHNPNPYQPLPTPVKPEILSNFLHNYDLHDYLVDGFTNGFKINCHGFGASFQVKNHKSALQNSNIVSALIDKEITLGRYAGPFTSPPLQNMTFSPLGLVPKKEPGKFRLIHDLSYPKGNAVNDFISTKNSTVSYETLDDVIKLVKICGPGALIAKCDIEEAFRQIPVHPSDYRLLGFTWNNFYYYDRCLAMGCSSSCRIFETFSRALQWLVKQIEPAAMVSHILDDFIFVGPANSVFCQEQLQLFLSICSQIALPIKANKTVLPCTNIIVHGLELQTLKMLTILPQEKIVKAISLLLDLSHKKKITLRELQRIIGVLNFACRAVVPGRTFLRRIIGLSMGLTKPFQHARVNKEARADAEAWLSFFKHFNGTSFFLHDPWLSSESIKLGTDASGHHYAGIFSSKWFIGAWPLSWLTHNIAVKELFPIVLAIELWAHSFANKKIVFMCDNMAVVDIINAASSKDPLIMKYVRRLVVVALKYNILFRAKHIAGKLNTICDLLSRSYIQEAQTLAPWLDRSPTTIPAALLPQ